MEAYPPQEVGWLYHSSHLHALQLIPSDHNLPQTRCCELKERQNPVYGCRPCNFYIHKTCAELPSYIRHPSHPSHTLTLLPTSPYLQGTAACGACWKQLVHGFSYHCTSCSFDLHTDCAFLSPTINLPTSHPHLLYLRFSTQPFNSYICDLCRRQIAKEAWFYHCQQCDFEAHTDCIQLRRDASPLGVARPWPIDGRSSFNAATQAPNAMSSLQPASWPVDGQPEPTAAATGKPLNPLSSSTPAVWPAQVGAPGHESSGLDPLHDPAKESAQVAHENRVEELKRGYENLHIQGTGGALQGSDLENYASQARRLKQLRDMAAYMAAVQVDAARATSSLVSCSEGEFRASYFPRNPRN